jgi:hypothetical protein
MFLPINGRIAIIDNEINEVEPLFKVLSKNRIPYIFIKGDEMEYLPEETDESNDLRLVFLDLNLLGQRVPKAKEVKASLYPLLKRVISKNNFPYSIIIWSKQESEYYEVVHELFESDLSDRKPISIETFIKSDFFSLDEKKEEGVKRDIIDELKKIFLKHQSYSTLVYWENKVHKSADNVLQGVFNSYDSTEWVDRSNYTIVKLGESYAGRKTYNKYGYVEKTKASLQAFNAIFNDTLEYNVFNSINIQEQENLEFETNKFKKSDQIGLVNEKLLVSKSDVIIEYPGTVSEDKNPISNKIFEVILNESFDRKSIDNEIDSSIIDKKQREKEIYKLSSSRRKEIRSSWQKIYMVVTPLCDYVQNKNSNNRVVKGFIFDHEFLKYIDNKSEALFITPLFYDNQFKKNRVLVLNFRYFFTENVLLKVKYIEPIFRFRSQVLSEVQSKLSRHINRQGILFIDDI